MRRRPERLPLEINVWTRTERDMKLHEGIKGESYLVREVMVADRLTRRLEALGVNEKTKITIMNKKKSGTLIVKVRGTRLALGRGIAEGIEIQPLDGREGTAQ